MTYPPERRKLKKTTLWFQGCVMTETLTVLVEGKIGTNTLENCLQYTLCISYGPAILLLGIYPAEMFTYVHQKYCTQKFTEALFIMVQK